MLRRFSTPSFSLSRRSSSSASSIVTSVTDALESTITSLPDAAIDDPVIDSKTISQQDLIIALETIQSTPRKAYSQKLILLAKIQQILEEEESTREVFVSHGGYLSATLSVLYSLEEVEREVDADTEDLESDNLEVRTELRYELVKLVFAILDVNLRGNELNRGIFSESVGFSSLALAIRGLMNEQAQNNHHPIDLDSSNSIQSTPPSAEKLLSILYSFLISDFYSPPIFTSLRLQLNSKERNTDENTIKEDSINNSSKILQLLLENNSVIENAEIAVVILELADTLSDEQAELKLMVISSIYALAISSRQSQVLLCEQGILNFALPKVFGDEKVSALAERKVWSNLISRLMEVGAKNEDVKYLLKKLVGSKSVDEEVLDLLLHSSKISQSSSMFNFDFSTHGFSSISIPSLGNSNPFPPATLGYSFITWIQIVEPPSMFDGKLIIFSASDFSKCFLEISIDSNLQINLSTSTKSPIVFTSFTLELNKLYHIVLVHQKSKFLSNSPVMLYIDGKLIESTKQIFPSPSLKSSEVSAWLGSPKETGEVGRIGKGKSRMIFELGSTWLLHADLNEEQVNLIHSLGCRYNSNFQDSLGQFQDSLHSAINNFKFNASNNSSNTKSNKNSTSLTPLSSKVGAIVTENRIYFSFSAEKVVGFASSNEAAFSNLPPIAKENLISATRIKERSVVNSAIPIAEFASSSSSFGQIVGPSIVLRNGLDIIIGTLGGMSIVLKVIELSSNPSILSKSIQLFASLLDNNPRNVTEAKKDRSYEILAQILRSKSEIISTEVSKTLFKLAGFNFNEPTQSIIINDEVIRYLILDFDIWSSSKLSTIQSNHFQQLKIFIDSPEFGDWNCKKLAKMHLTRKILSSLRSNSFNTTIIPQAVELLFSVVSQNFTTESIRHIATFITAGLCKSKPARLIPLGFVLDASLINQSLQDFGALQVLLELHHLLLDTSKSKELNKFCKTITNKWMLTLIFDVNVDPFGSILAFRILIRALQTQGDSYVNKFGTEKAPILLDSINRFWNYGQIILALLALLHSHDITTLPLNASFESTTFTQNTFSTNSLTPIIIRILIKSIITGFEALKIPEDQATEVVEDLESSIPLSQGFDILLELVGKTRFAGGGKLISSSSALHDLTTSLGQHSPKLVSKAPSEYTTLSLPILSITEKEILSSETTSSSLVSFSAPSKSINSLIHVLSLQAVYFLTNYRNSNSEEEEASESSLQVLEEIFDSSALLPLLDQISFRTAILRDSMKRVLKSPFSPTLASRVSLFVMFATDISFEGWNVDINGLLDFVLIFMERIFLQVDSFSSPSCTTQTIDSLFRSLNRLVLFALSRNVSEALSTINLLIRQLTLFATQNSDADFFRCLIQRLDFILRQPEIEEKVSVVVIDFFKLVILQRPIESEASLKQVRIHDSQARLTTILIDANNEQFLELLKKHQDQLDSLQLSWNEMIDFETRRARKQVNRETSRLEIIANRSTKKSQIQVSKIRKLRINLLEWQQSINDVEIKRVTNIKQDASEQQSAVSQEWIQQSENLCSSSSVFASENTYQTWEIDYVEGPFRIRSKLLPETKIKSKSIELKDEVVLEKNIVVEVVPSEVQVEVVSDNVSAIIEDLEETSIEVEEPEIEAEQEDKNRKIRRMLEPKDVILQVINSSRIVGLDSIQSLLLITSKNIYLIDNYFQNSNQELVNIWDVPKEERNQHLTTLAELSGQKLVVTSEAGITHQNKHWSLKDLVEVYERNYLFQSTALELFFRDGSSYLLVFSKPDRALVYSLLTKFNPEAVALGSLHLSNNSFGGKLQDAVRGKQSRLEVMTKKWELAQISNFEYLNFLNNQAGRTYNDLTNYPVFPWILSDYTSETLDLNSSASFRDLTLPIGAQNEKCRQRLRERYEQLLELGGITPFHYGTHYSNSSTTAGYLIRLQPFTAAYLGIQGEFDSDRMFYSLEGAFQSSTSSSTNVQEITPEFFYLPDFLRNGNPELNLGKRQENDESIDNVKLPKWAKGSPELFIQLHRKALESEYVDSKLNEWIDLIFGYKQTGQIAIDSLNIYNSLAYENAIDLDSVVDEHEKRTAIATIHNFGICSKQLFTKPHPTKIARDKSIPIILSPNIPIEEKILSLNQSIIPLIRNSNQILNIYASNPENITVSSTVLLPNDSKLQLIFGVNDNSLRVYSTENIKSPLAIFENLHDGKITCAIFSDEKTLITASIDSTLAIWEWYDVKESISPKLLSRLRGHSNSVSAISVSRAFGIIVSGSDKEAIVWDLNRHRFVHRLVGHESRVNLIAISDSTGDIVTVSGSVFRVWSVNGMLLARQTTSSYLDPITSITFSLSQDPIIATGHSNGIVMFWKRIPSGEGTTFSWKLELLRKIQHKYRLESIPTSPLPNITALAFTRSGLYSGDQIGRLSFFSPPGTDIIGLPDSISSSCMNCSSTFRLLDSRKRCTSCSGIFCSSSICTTSSGKFVFCQNCFNTVSPSLIVS